MKRIFPHLVFHSDLAGALRAAGAFSLALIGCSALGMPEAGQFAATAALGVSLPQLRGAYHVRVLVLAVMITVLAAATLLGGLNAQSTVGAMAGIAVLALLSGVWRHLSADYGMPLGVDSALLFLLGLEGSAHGMTPAQMAAATVAGGLLATALHLALWLVRPQHPLRHAVAESWVAASDLFLAFRTSGAKAAAADLPAQRQRQLRDALDRATATLTAPTRQDAALIEHLQHMRHEAAHFAMKVTAFYTASEPLRAAPGCGPHAPTLDTVLVEIANLARSVAVTLITHRPENLGITEARLQTCKLLMSVLDEQLAHAGLEEGIRTQLRTLLAAMMAELAEIDAGLAQTVDPLVRPQRVLFRLPDLSTWPLRALAAWLNPAPVVDPGLVRYAVRMAVLCVIAVGLYKIFEIPRGYWMAFAVIVVLQPDYGATRKRAGQRVGGTFAGALLASALLFVPLPLWLMGALTGLTAFAFAYFIKTRYGLAIFFVTVMLVMLTELHAPVHLDFTIARLLSNLAGAGLALLAALFFWPNWEREKFPTLLAKALRANSAYLEAVAGAGVFRSEVVPAKQKAERAGHQAAASLQRMLQEPERQREASGPAIGAVTSNERITRAISVLATHLAEGTRADQRETAGTVARLHAVLEHAAAHFESRAPVPETKMDVQAPVSSSPGPLPFSLEKLAAEVQALVIALRDSSA